MNATHVIMAAPLFSAGLALSFLGFYRRVLLQPIYLYWLLFASGIVCFLLVQAEAAGIALGPVGTIASIVGIPACGMSWLLSRALFRRDGAATLWPLGVVLALCLTSLLIVLARLAGIGSDNAVMEMVGTVHGLTSSTVLLLALVEPVEGFRRSLPRAEKLFRLIFILGYGALVAVSVIWERQAVQATDGETALSAVKVTCAMIALAGATLAVAWRARHPMPAAVTEKTPRDVTEADRALGARIAALLAAEPLHTETELKVGTLAARLGEPDYKVTRAITGAMGFANFNRLINSYRIAHAQRLLADPACADWSVLSIALDCGFGSIGPFNRAFKDETGTTPGAWRAAQLRGDQATGGIAVARSASR